MDENERSSSASGHITFEQMHILTGKYFTIASVIQTPVSVGFVYI
jgi:hypothetical protein